MIAQGIALALAQDAPPPNGFGFGEVDIYCGKKGGACGVGWRFFRGRFLADTRYVRENVQDMIRGQQVPEAAASEKVSLMKRLPARLSHLLNYTESKMQALLCDRIAHKLDPWHWNCSDVGGNVFVLFKFVCKFYWFGSEIKESDNKN